MPQSSIKYLAPGSKIHLMGICGTAMASLAGLLKDRGFQVSGSDSNPYPPMSTQIEDLGIKIAKPYSKENLQPPPDFVVVGNVISAQNEEAQEMNRLGLNYCSLPQAMGDVIIDQRLSYVVAGTHGKTTTTSLLAWVAEKCGQEPGFLIGGVAKNFSQSFKNPKGNLFVIEGDEYDTAYFDKVPKFIHYKPQRVILTSVEFDHADIYSDFAAVKNAFVRLMKLIPEVGVFTYWGDDVNVCDVAEHCAIKNKYSYGFSQSSHFRAEILLETEFVTEFSVYFNNELLGRFKTPLSGRYNILNATAVIAQAHLSQWNLSRVIEALDSFQGVKRRQDVLGVFDEVTLIEDFAHHPTAVRETVQAIQKKYQGRKVFSVFEPRSATSRRKIFQKDYLEAFSQSQEIVLAEAFDQGKISEEARFSSAELALELSQNGKKARVFPTAQLIADYLLKETSAGDVVLIMSNGGFDGIYEKLIQGLRSRAESK